MSEYLSDDEALRARSHIRRNYSESLNAMNLVGSHAFLLVPNSKDTAKAEAFFVRQFINQTGLSPFGITLLQKFVKVKSNGTLISSVDIKLFSDIPLKNGGIDDETPMWMTDRLIHHELMGAFHSKEDEATIALNNFQFRESGLYTFVHEVFHLVDGNTLTGSEDLDDFLAEYRAVLAEALFYKEFTDSNDDDRNLVSEWHEDMLTVWKREVDTDKVFKSTLDLFYPKDPKFKISKIQAIGRTQIEESRNTYQFIVNSLTKFTDDPSLTEQTAVLEFSEDRSALNKIAEENKAKRAIIEAFYKDKKNEHLFSVETLKVLLEKGFNLPGAGHGGPKPRNSGAGGNRSGGGG